MIKNPDKKISTLFNLRRYFLKNKEKLEVDLNN
jgi:hypothetical protein